MDKITITINCPHCGTPLTVTTTPGKHTLSFCCDICEKDVLVTVDTRKQGQVGPEETKA